MTKNMVIYDCEIIKAIPPFKQGEERLPDIEYCEGWHDFANMGISVIGMYDYADDRYHVFCKDNFREFFNRVQDAAVVVDFNGFKFDKPLLEANIGEIEFNHHYDILREIWKALGNNPDEFNAGTHSGYGLDMCCAANFGSRKSGHGALAPIDWQRGNIGSVIDYCLNDVRLTKNLLDLIISRGHIINPKDTDRVIRMADPLFFHRG